MRPNGSYEKIRCFGRHEHIVLEGDLHDRVFRLEEGWAGRYCVVSSGARQITDLFLPGDICEPQWILSGRSDLPVIALTPIRVAEIPLTTIHQGSGEGVRALLAGCVETLSRQTQLIIRLGRTSAKDRVAGLLFDLYSRLSRSGHVDNGRCQIPITQQDIGDLLGLSAVHVNRVLRQLRKEGSIYISGRTLVITDTERPHVDIIEKDMKATTNGRRKVAESRVCGATAFRESESCMFASAGTRD